MVESRQLVWVHKNRRKKGRGRLVGDLMQTLVQRVSSEGEPGSKELASIITDTVDQEFLAHCRLAEIARRTLVINVDPAALVYSMRQRWGEVLRKALLAGCRGTVTNVTFKYGRTGMALSGR
jgi:hypothetical protein